MTSNRIRLTATLVAASLALIALSARAGTVGGAEAGVNRISGDLAPYYQEIVIPTSATDYETPTANVAAFLPPDGWLQVRALASAGIDVPDGAVFGTIATFGARKSPESRRERSRIRMLSTRRSWKCARTRFLSEHWSTSASN